MSFKENIKPSYTIKKLTLEEFNKNPGFYQKSLDEISLSQEIGSYKKNGRFASEDWDNFFKKHPVNSIVYIKEKEKIVSFMYATPHRDYEGFEDKDLGDWGIDYIQTHKNFEGKGYAQILILFGLEDMKKEGARRIEFIPNEKSLPIFTKVISDNKIGNLTKWINKTTLTFNETFLKKENSINHEQDK